MKFGENVTNDKYRKSKLFQYQLINDQLIFKGQKVVKCAIRGIFQYPTSNRVKTQKFNTNVTNDKNRKVSYSDIDQLILSCRKG